VRDIGILQPAKWLHIDDQRAAVGAHQIVGYPTNTFSRNRSLQLEGLADDLSRRWIEVGQHQPREFKPRFISHVRVLGRAPIQACVVFLSQVPRKRPPWTTSCDGIRIEALPLFRDDAAVGGLVGTFEEVSASYLDGLHWLRPLDHLFIHAGDRFAVRKAW
jgi:hypothetical protein